jgi:hypothetical protein
MRDEKAHCLQRSEDKYYQYQQDSSTVSSASLRLKRCWSLKGAMIIAIVPIKKAIQFVLLSHTHQFDRASLPQIQVVTGWKLKLIKIKAICS